MDINVQELPSKGIPYDFVEFSMTNFGVPEIMLLSKATSLESITPAIEAMNNVVSINAYQLTDGDFFYLLALQRLNMTKPLFTDWTCDGTVFVEEETGRRLAPVDLRSMVEHYNAMPAEDKANEKDPSEIVVTNVACEQKNHHDLKLSDLKITYLEDKVLPTFLDYPRISTLTEAILDASSPEMQMLAFPIRWFKTPVGDAYSDKKDYFESLQSLEQVEEAIKTNNAIIHGVNKTVVCSCSACGKETAHLFEIHPHTFFDA